MECFLYHTVVLNFPRKRTQHFLETIDSKPASFFATRVQRLYLTDQVSFDAAKKILSVCTGLSTLACWVHPLLGLSPGPAEPLLPLLSSNSSLHRLSVRIHRLIEWRNDGSNITELFNHPIFQNLTHLDIVTPPGAVYPEGHEEKDSPSLRKGVWESLSIIPKLKHISFGQVHIHRTDHHRDIIRSLPYLLDNCPSLEDLVVVTTDHCVVDAVSTIKDPRCRAIPYFSFPKTLDTFWDDLSCGGYGAKDFWDLTTRSSKDGVTVGE
ncbi:hypothetical protein V5O48_006346 [Marasmius crinis-equi]|uniref:Uncharacterized protein n=1 Tax=Marasmius crinis-equi TaxID=585013 RepID=A0ABR3FJQ8_9AGAR